MIAPLTMDTASFMTSTVVTDTAVMAMAATAPTEHPAVVAAPRIRLLVLVLLLLIFPALDRGTPEHSPQPPILLILHAATCYILTAETPCRPVSKTIEALRITFITSPQGVNRRAGGFHGTCEGCRRSRGARTQPPALRSGVAGMPGRALRHRRTRGRQQACHAGGHPGRRHR